ncbi:MAG: Uma2 family endonuclease [Isosphaeraceae bacterium]
MGTPTMSTGIVGETRIAIKGVPWTVYETWIDSLPEGTPVRMAYDGRDLEIMVKGPVHESFRDLLGRFVREVSESLAIPLKSLGETTWKRPDVERGLEADQCYFFAAEKIDAVADAVARRSNDVADYPNPDLAIEVDISPSSVDRPGIYAALRVPEVWRFDGESVTIEQLDPELGYQQAATSRWLFVRGGEVARWLLREDTRDERDWAERLRRWTREDLATRRP